MNRGPKKRLKKRGKRRARVVGATYPQRLIYGLVDPTTLLIRYVGLSSNGMNRPREHRRPSCPDTYCRRWVRALQELSLDYDIVTLESVDQGTELAERERWWIAFGKACGWPLTNLTDGGGPSEAVLARRRQCKIASGAARAEEQLRYTAALEAACREENCARRDAAHASIAADTAVKSAQTNKAIRLDTALAVQRKVDTAFACQERLRRAVAAVVQLRQQRRPQPQVHWFCLPKDPPQRVACTCGHQEPFEDHDALEGAVTRLNAHIQKATAAQG